LEPALYVHTRSPTGVCDFMHAAYAGGALYPGAGPDAGEAAVERSVLGEPHRLVISAAVAQYQIVYDFAQP
jgi:hypothetical protein